MRVSLYTRDRRRTTFADLSAKFNSRVCTVTKRAPDAIHELTPNTMNLASRCSCDFVNRSVAQKLTKQLNPEGHFNSQIGPFQRIGRMLGAMSDPFPISDDDVIDVTPPKRTRWRRWVIAAVVLLFIMLSRSLSDLCFGPVVWLARLLCRLLVHIQTEGSGSS